LAKQVHEATRDADWSQLKGIILLHHGIITFDDDGKASYERMIELVNRAEGYLRSSGAWERTAGRSYTGQKGDFQDIARLRRQASQMMGSPMLLRWNRESAAVGFSALSNVGELVRRGPLTPDHSIHTKPFMAVFDEQPEEGLGDFQTRYQHYFESHAAGHHTCLDTVPRLGVWQNRGMLAFAPDHKRLTIVGDIADHTIRAIQWGEAMGGWQALPRQDQFDLEYWELEQAKLKRAKSRGEFEGRVVLVTGAGSGIGRACVDAFVAQGAVVAALDIRPVDWDSPQVLALTCDVTDNAAVEAAVQRIVAHFGGIDVLVSNPGNPPPSCQVQHITDELWQQSLDLKLSSHMRVMRACIPFLELGLDPSVVIVGSKNVPAPGPGASAYSVAKAGLAQLARVAALELGGKGIRVNTIHPNAVFDTSLWTDAVLAQRALSYQLSVDDYKKNNVLGRSIESRDVAKMAVLMAGEG